jgi:ubiquinol-cytochrome c reductase iron-sulfur subunit
MTSSRCSPVARASSFGGSEGGEPLFQQPANASLKAQLHAPGGFYCPCHGSRYDLAGRVLKNMPAPTNPEIPDYRFTGGENLTIGTP